MTLRVSLLAGVAAVGLLAGVLLPEFVPSVRVRLDQFAPAKAQPRREKPHQEDAGHSHGAEKPGAHGHSAGEPEGVEGMLRLTDEQIAAAKITVAGAGSGTLARRISVPGTIVPDANRVARVAAKVVGTVADLRKRLGDQVSKGEVVAIVDSREVADAKSEHVSSQVNLELQKTLFEREQALFEKKISAEQQFLRARQTFTEAQLRSDLARQKLIALNVSDHEIATLSRQSSGLQRYEIRSPLAGRVVERLVDLGAPVGGEGQAKEIYVVADLSSLWVDLAVSAVDLLTVQEGQRVTISTGSPGRKTDGRIAFISPMLNQETRSARVVAEIENKDLAWRPGSYVTAHILFEEQAVNIRVPRAAVQTISGESVVFVRNDAGFEKRDVVLGSGDEENVEIVFGLDPGEKIAITNSFVLKAELGKSEAEHAH